MVVFQGTVKRRGKKRLSVYWNTLFFPPLLVKTPVAIRSIPQTSVDLPSESRLVAAHQRCGGWIDRARYLLVEALKTAPASDAICDAAVLEDRVLLSATPIVQAIADGGLETGDLPLTFDPNLTADNTNVTPAAQQAVVQRRELVIIDPAVGDYQQLIDGLENQDAHHVDVLLLDGQRDGVLQITDFLAGYDDIDAIHIVSHAENGAVKLGNVWLSESNLAGYAGSISGWQTTLAEDADILFYGCELAENQAGREFVQSLSGLTGADVAASIDDTGHGTLGGDWELEYVVGVLETEQIFAADVQQHWTHLLATTETHYFLVGNGIPEATLDTGLPTSTSMQDYDAGRHAGDGTMIQKGGSGSGETDAVKHQVWTTTSGNISIDGQVSLTLWSAVKGFDDSKGATVHAYLIDVQQNGSDPQILGTATVSRGVWSSSGDWVEDTFDFGPITQSLGNPRRLQVKIIVDGSSDDDMLFAYDDVFHRSHLQVGMTTSNADPSLNPGGGALNYTENDPAAPIAPSLTLSDDDANLQWAVVQITGNHQSGEDVLSFSGPIPGGLSMNYDANSGQMVFSGSSSVANYRAALQGVRYENSSQDPNTGARTVTFSVYDGQNFSSASREVTVVSVNDAPTASLTVTDSGQEDQNLVYTHAQMLALIGGADVDNASADLDVNITNVTNATFNQSGSGDATTYTFNLTPPTHANGYAVTFDYEITDIEPLSSGVGSATITIQAVNDAPGLMIGGDQNVNEDTGLHFVALFAGATPGGGLDEIGQSFTYILNNNNASLFSVAPDIDTLGNLTYTLAPDAFGTATVTVSVQDSGGTANGGDNTSASQQFDINVANSNNDDAFVAVNNGLTLNENATLGITATELRADDPDLPEASSLVYSITNAPTQGQLELTTAPTVGVLSFTQDDIDSGKLVYVHFGDEAPLTDSFTFTVSDGIGSPTTPQVFNITINAQNDAPINAVRGTQTTQPDTALVFSAGNGNLVSVSDDDAGAADVEVTLNVTNGTVTLDLPVNTATATGPESSLASNTTGIQQDTRVASLPDGRFVVVWSGSGPGDSDGIYMRQFNADGTPIGSQTRMNGNGAKAKLQSQPSVAVNDSGRIVVSWTSNDQDAALTDGVFFRAVNWDGSNDTDEIAANTSTSGDQNESVVEIDADGNVIVVWTDDNALDGQNEGIFARRFDAAGTPIDATEWQVASTWAYKQRTPAIAMNNNGQFVIVWQDSKADGQNEGVFAKRFDANANPLDAPGTPGEAEFQVNTSWLKNQHLADVAIDNAGNFVVVWAAEQQDASEEGIWGQLYDASGNRTGPSEFQVHTTETWDQINPSVAMDANGDFVVVWEHDTAEFGPKDIRFQQFDKTATKIGGEQTANNSTTGDQNAPDVSMDAQGNFVIVWDGQTTAEADDGAVARQYELPPSPLTFSSGDGLVDSFVKFRGSVADVNAALEGMLFAPTPSFTGTATININVDDLGNTGPGGAKADNDNITINVTNVNSSPTGSVTISGVATEDQVLTAGNSLADPDGLGTISYQWQRGGVDIGGATGSTYTLSDADVGTMISVVASYTDGGAFSESVSSTTVGPVANVNDTPGGTVTITGTPSEDQTLTAANTLTDDDGLGAISYQWQRGGVDIGGATGATYTLGDADVGTMISVVASYTDGDGFSESVSSAAVGPVANVNDTPGGTVTITGTASLGNVLTAGNTLSDADGLGAISYQWKRNGVDIGGATGTTYTLVAADVSTTITVVASYTDGQGTLESKVSAAVGPVSGFNTPPTGTVTISGTPTEDQTLTAGNTLADVDGLGPIGYQWRRDGVDIGGATGATYTLGDADVGTMISVVASYTDGGGTNESQSSAVVGAIANVNDTPTGSVTISGTPTENQTLTAGNTLADVDGLGAIGYQWRRDGVDIGGATGATYTLGDADVGTMISVVASYIDGGGTNESVGSGSVGAIANINDTPTGSVTISGTPTENQTLTAGNTLADVDGLGAISYQWRRDGVDIGGATGVTYTLGDADVGTMISVVASYTDGGGTNESESSVAVGAIANVNDTPTGNVTISGTPTEDQTLTAGNTLADVDGLGAIGYQWRRDGVDIGGATGATYTLGDADVGTMISVVASYTDGGGTNESESSAAVGAIANINDTPTGNVTISGTPTEDQTLTAGNTLADVDGLGAIGYQWRRDGVDIGGATGATYTLGDADVGTMISVVASYNDGGGTNESESSAAVGAIANVNDAPVGHPTIAGTFRTGHTISANTSGIRDADGLGAFSYQWFKNGTAMVGETNATLTLGDDDIGQSITVSVAYVDGYGAAEGPLGSLAITPTEVTELPPARPEATSPRPEPEPPADASEAPTPANSDDITSPSEVVPVVTSSQPSVTQPATTVVAKGPLLVLAQQKSLSALFASQADNWMGTIVNEAAADPINEQAEAEARDPITTAYATAMGQIRAAIAQPELWQGISSMQDQVGSSVSTFTFAIGATVGATTGITVGYVVWVIRGGILLSSVMANLPMWRLMDPMAILNAVDGTEHDDESLESMVEEPSPDAR